MQQMAGQTQQPLVLTALVQKVGGRRQGRQLTAIKGLAQLRQGLAKSLWSQQVVKTFAGPGKLEQLPLSLMRGVQRIEVAFDAMPIGRQCVALRQADVFRRQANIRQGRKAEERSINTRHGASTVSRARESVRSASSNTGTVTRRSPSVINNNRPLSRTQLQRNGSPGPVRL